MQTPDKGSAILLQTARSIPAKSETSIEVRILFDSGSLHRQEPAA